MEQWGLGVVGGGGGGLVTGGDGEVMERLWKRPGKLKV